MQESKKENQFVFIEYRGLQKVIPLCDNIDEAAAHCRRVFALPNCFEFSFKIPKSASTQQKASTPYVVGYPDSNTNADADAEIDGLSWGIVKDRALWISLKQTELAFSVAIYTGLSPSSKRGIC